MPTIDFPTSPSVNDTYTFNGKTWKWNGSGWDAVISTLVQIDTQTFTSSTTYTIPAGAQFIFVECIGAGGGGSGNGGRGGAGGGYWEEWIPVSALTSPVTVTIGAGGTGAGGTNGGKGGDSRFGTCYFPGAVGGSYSAGYGAGGFVTPYLSASSSYDATGIGFGAGGPQYPGASLLPVYEGFDSYKGGGGGGQDGYAGGKSYSTLPITTLDGLLIPTYGNGAAAGANGTGSDGGGGGGTGQNGGNGGPVGGGGGGGASGCTGGNGGNAQIKIWVYG